MAHFFTFTPKKKAATDIDFIHLIESTGMKILVATEKPFAKEAVDGIRRIVEDAGYELALLEKYTDKAQLLAGVADVVSVIVPRDNGTAVGIGAAKNLKIVVRAGAGYDNVDLAAATARGIVVMNTPGQNSNAVAELDVLAALAQVAAENNYCRPVVDDSDELTITEGRHPVVEQVLKGSLFVPNDTTLNCGEDRCLIITGPNMAGKSTYMRQNALIALMAQIGSFVPAASCHVGVVDAIFTRIGASDDLSAGQSTFMVEMTEVATILNEATRNSLVILDEIGRGTSTYDGVSIAKAVAEYISSKAIGCKTLFATHYHELT